MRARVALLFPAVAFLALNETHPNRPGAHSHHTPQAPEDGAYIRGMFVEGARWDAETQLLADSLPKVLHSHAPLLLLRPAVEVRSFPHYACPLYRTPERRGVLATTGHSTNFVMELRVPSDRPQEAWVRAGVAFLLSLAD